MASSCVLRLPVVVDVADKPLVAEALPRSRFQAQQMVPIIALQAARSARSMKIIDDESDFVRRLTALATRLRPCGLFWRKCPQTPDLSAQSEFDMLTPSKFRWRNEHEERAHYWSKHIAAINFQGGTTSAYTQQHDLALASLYYWQRKLRSATTVCAVIEPTQAPRRPSKFIALTVSPILFTMWRGQ